MRWFQVAFGISAAATLLLQHRARRERKESHAWRGFRDDPPFDLSGIEQFDASNYTPSGQRAFRQFMTATTITAVLGLVLLYAWLL